MIEISDIIDAHLVRKIQVICIIINILNNDTRAIDNMLEFVMEMSLKKSFVYIQLDMVTNMKLNKHMTMILEGFISNLGGVKDISDLRINDFQLLNKGGCLVLLITLVR